MNNIQTIPKNSFTSDASAKFSFESLLRTGNFGKGLVIEKSISIGWLDKLYKGSVFDAFWSVLSAPVD
jgi:hypothetical protein